MEPRHDQDDGRFLVRCLNCGSDYNSLLAEWCNCTGSSRSLVCPHCGSCVCQTSTGQEASWSLAPVKMRERLRAVPIPGISSDFDVDDPCRPRVLVVDDDPSVREFTSRLLRSFGYSVSVATNGAEALEIARRDTCQVVVADALMPRMDGREMCRLLKSDPRTSWMKVIILTGVYVNPRYGIEARCKFLADDFLCKPINQVDLRRAVERQMGAVYALV